MPELPEVETLRQDLAKEVVGRKIKTVSVANGALGPPPPERQAVPGPRSRAGPSVGRRAWASTCSSASTAATSWSSTSGMSGQLLRVKSAKEPKPKHTHVVITFTQGGELRYVDPRTFGEMFVSTPPADADRCRRPPGRRRPRPTGRPAQGRPELAHLGFDPIEDMMSWDRFASAAASTTPAEGPAHGPEVRGGHRQHLLRRDPLRRRAPLRPSSDGLSATEIRRLYRAMVETLAEAIKHRGSTLADEQYRDLFGEVGDYQGSHQVYDREGQACRRCRNPIVRVKHRRPLDLLLRALPDLTDPHSAAPRSGSGRWGLVGSTRCS